MGYFEVLLGTSKFSIDMGLVTPGSSVSNNKVDKLDRNKVDKEDKEDKPF